MAAPSVIGTAGGLSGESATGTNHTVTYPPSMIIGETIKGCFSTDGNETITWPSAGNDVWTKIGTDNVGPLDTSTLSYAWHKANGSESANFTVTTGTNEKANAITVRVTGAADPDVTPPERSTGQNGTGLNNANSDTTTPTGGPKDFLFFSAMSIDGAIAATVAPSGYSNLTTAVSSGSGSNGLSIASKETTNVSSDDAGAFTHASEQWAAAGLAVHPAGGAPAANPKGPLGHPLRGALGGPV